MQPGCDLWMERAKVIVVGVHSPESRQIVRAAAARRGTRSLATASLCVLYKTKSSQVSEPDQQGLSNAGKPERP